MSQRFNRRRFNAVLAGAGAAAALAPFGSVYAEPAKLKVGVLLPRSGFQGLIGQSCEQRKIKSRFVELRFVKFT